MFFYNRRRNNPRSIVRRPANRLQMQALERRDMMAADGLLLSPGFNVADVKSSLIATKGDLTLVEWTAPVGAVFASGVLTVTGSSGNDNISIHAEQGLLIVREVVKNVTWLSVGLTSVTRFYDWASHTTTGFIVSGATLPGRSTA